PGRLHQRIDRRGAFGQQAVDVRIGIEAGGEAGVGLRQLLTRPGGPGGVLLSRVLGRSRRTPVGRDDAGHRSLSSPGRRVRISTPSSVTATVCSHCADNLRSLVTTVQPSGRTRVWRAPSLIIGSMVKVMPGFSTTPCPGRPYCSTFGSPG